MLGGIIGDLIASKQAAKVTLEWASVTVVSDDTMEIALANTRPWADERQVILLLTRAGEVSPASPPQVTTAPPPPPPPPTIEVKAGMTIEEVEGAAGAPQAKATVGEKTIYRYDTMIVTFVDAKVVDVSFR
jgi:hypothetical protein